MTQRTLLALGGLLLASQPALATAPVGDPLAGLQAMRELNAVVLGDTQGWLEVQGKTFVAGDVKNGGEFGTGNAAKGAAGSDRATLTVGGRIQNYTRLRNGANGAAGPVGAPAGILAGGNVSQLDLAAGNAIVKVGGSIANTSGSTGSTIESGGAGHGYLNANGGTITTNKGAAFTAGLQGGINSEAQKLEADLTSLSASLSGLGTTAGNSSTSKFGAWTFNAVSDGTGKSVFNLTEAAFSGWRWTLNVADPTLTVIFNITGDGSYDWNSTLAGAFAGLSDKVIWNFGDANRLDISQTVYGSILAPFARVGANSALNGSIVAGELKADSGVKLGTYAGGNLGFVEPEAVPEPATWAMLIAGFGLVGAMMRRRNRGIARASA
jgi:choice-of-anchor A domain-containing protein